MVKLRESEGGHQLAKLEQVGEQFDEESVIFVKKEDDAVTTQSAMKKIHNILNHKSKEEMIYAYIHKCWKDKTSSREVD